MGKLEYFTIRLPKENPIYTPGEKLKGDLLIRVIERLKINSLKLIIMGAAYVYWTEGTGKNKRSYSENEFYFNFNFLLNSKQDNNDLYLEPGDYSYPFNVDLPQSLPTSFMRRSMIYTCSVGYTIRGILDIPWSFNKNTIKSFSIVSPLDLNASPNLRQPYDANDTRILCCWCCKSEPITATLNVRKGGFVPGETIVFSFMIENSSSRRINSIDVILLQKITLQTLKSKSKTFLEEIVKVGFPRKIEAKSQDRWDNVSLKVPPTCSSSNGLCRILEVNYCLQLNYDPDGFTCSKYNGIIIPITIGTIPLINEGVRSGLPGYLQFSYEPFSINESSPDNTELPPAYDALAGEMVETNANTFKPHYPFYKNFSNAI